MTKRVTPVAQSGKRGGYLERSPCMSTIVPKDAAWSENASARASPASSSILSTTSRSQPWHEAGGRPSISIPAAPLPIRFKGEIVGAYAVYAGEKDVFGDKEVTLLQEAAATISFALDHLDREDQRRRAEEALRERESSLPGCHRDHSRRIFRARRRRTVS